MEPRRLKSFSHSINQTKGWCTTTNWHQHTNSERLAFTEEGPGLQRIWKLILAGIGCLRWLLYWILLTKGRLEPWDYKEGQSWFLRVKRLWSQVSLKIILHQMADSTYICSYNVGSNIMSVSVTLFEDCQLQDTDTFCTHEAHPCSPLYITTPQKKLSTFF